MKTSKDYRAVAVEKDLFETENISSCSKQKPVRMKNQSTSFCHTTKKTILIGALLLCLVVSVFLVWSNVHEKSKKGDDSNFEASSNEEYGIPKNDFSDNLDETDKAALERDKADNKQPIPKLRSYSSERPDGKGHTFIFLNKDPSNNRRVGKKLRFPVARYDNRRPPTRGPFIRFLPKIGMFADRRTKQTFICGRSGSLYVLPPLRTPRGHLFPVGALVASGHASFKPVGSSKYDRLDMKDYYIPTPIYGPRIPRYNTKYHGFVGSIDTDYEIDENSDEYDRSDEEYSSDEIYEYSNKKYDRYNSYDSKYNRNSGYGSKNNYKTSTSTTTKKTVVDLCETGKQQSPILVKLSETKFTSFPRFSFSEFYRKAISLKIEIERGVTMTFKPIIDDVKKLNVRGGCLTGDYYFDSGHIHFPQSEHVIKGKDFVAEAHFIHRHIITGELAVLGYFFELSEFLSAEVAGVKSWETLFGDFTSRTVNIEDGLQSLMLGSETDFVCYHGSLTTPPCAEGVHWVLISSSIPIKQSRIDGLKTNIAQRFFRDTQPLNNRVVEKSFSMTEWPFSRSFVGDR